MGLDHELGFPSSMFFGARLHVEKNIGCLVADLGSLDPLIDHFCNESLSLSS